MGLDITTSTPSGRDWFTTGEEASGTVTWANTSTSIVSRINVYLEGVLETGTKPIFSGHESPFGTVTRVVFARSQALYPPCTSLAKRCSTFGPGQYAFKYSLALPCKEEDPDGSKFEASLPTNFAFTADGVKVTMRFRVRVVIERQGLLKSKLTKERTIEFRPLLQFFCPLGGREWQTSSCVSVNVNKFDFKGSTELEKNPSMPSVTLKACLHGPKILRPGNPVSLSISFTIPVEIRPSFEPTWIFRISIRLKARTAAIAAGNTREHVGYVDIFTFQGILPVAMEETEPQVILPSILWEHCVYPAAIPTFQFNVAWRTYQLEVSVEFANAKAAHVHKATALIDVKLESGALFAPEMPQEAPPEYSLDAP